MSEANEMKSSASGSESVGAALQAATVFGASDGLISEKHEAEARGREDTQAETVIEQWTSFSGSSEEEEAQEESSGAGKTGRSAGVVSPATVQGAAVSAAGANVAMAPDVAAAGSVATGVPEAGGDAAVSGDADEEETEEESDDTEESAGDETEEASEESSDSSGSEEESAAEPAVTTAETIAPVSGSDSSFDPAIMEHPIIIYDLSEAVPDESVVTITVTGTNDDPDAGAGISLGSSSEDSLVEITEAALLANASDVDGDQLSVRNLASEQGTLSNNDPPFELTAAVEALSHTINTQPTGNGATFVTLNEHAADFASVGTGAISLWVKLDSGHGSATLLSMADSTTRTTQSFFIAGNNTRTMTDESLTFAAMEGNTHLSMMVRQGQDYLFDNQWHHVAVVVDGIDNRMYIDGERAAVHFKNGSATTDLFTGADIDLVNIGSLVRNGDPNGTLTANGEIAEVAIFGSTGGLNDSSVQALMNQGPDYFNGSAESNDLLFSTDFAGIGDTVTDTSGHGRDGTAFSGNLAPRDSFTVDVEVVEDGTLLLQEVDLLNGFSDPEGDSLSVRSVTADHGTVVDRGDGHWIFTPDNNFHGKVSFSIEITDGTDTLMAVRTAMVASDQEGSFNIAGSTFQIVEGDVLGTEFAGKIMEDNGYTSLDQWLLTHEGGVFSVSLNTADGSSWSAGVRLLHSDANGAFGAEVAQFSGLLSATGQGGQVLEFNDLPAGHYQLVLGNDGFEESSATSALDYPGVVSGEHNYEVVVSGRVSVADLPRDPGQNALITGETQGQTEGILTLAVVNNEAEMMDTGNTLHYEVFNHDVRVGQGELDFNSGVSAQNIVVTINNEPLETLTLDEIQLVFHEINSSGEVVGSQTFGFDQATIPDGGTVAAQGGDGLQGVELMELGLNYFELGFSELMDGMQGEYPG